MAKPKIPAIPSRYHRTLTIGAPVARVWEGLTDGAWLVRWFCDALELELRPGGTFRPGGPSCPTVEPAAGEVLAVDPERRLELRWPLDGVDTTLRFDLEPTGDTTRLEVTHTCEEGRWPTWLDLPALHALNLTNLRTLLERPGLREVPLRMDFTTPNSGLIWLGMALTVLPARAYLLLTEPLEIRRWLSPQARIEAREGGRLDLGWPALRPSKVLALKKNRLLVHDWNDTRLAGPTKVTWSIMPEKAVTRLEFLHEGFSPEDELRPLRLRWSAALVMLRDEAENGRSLGLEWEDRSDGGA